MVLFLLADRDTESLFGGTGVGPFDHACDNPGS